MSDGILDEAYERFACTGPEWGENTLTNHGPMAVEVLVRRGLADEVPAWVDQYVGRLSELPSVSDRITSATWKDALGDGHRIGDWSAFFVEQMQEQPWRDVLVTWWPRLLPGIVAGATHGVIRVSHAVRTLLSGDESPAAVTELAHGLAFWAARMRAVPGAVDPAGSMEMLDALDAIPRIPSQQGTVAVRFGQLAELPAWPTSLRALRAPSGPEDARAQLADLVAGASARYLTHGHGSPVLLVHTATAPNAVLHTLPVLTTIAVGAEPVGGLGRQCGDHLGLCTTVRNPPCRAADCQGRRPDGVRAGSWRRARHQVRRHRAGSVPAFR